MKVVCSLLFIFFLLACEGSQENTIVETLNKREKALREKDFSLYLSCISKEYHDKDGDIHQLEKRIEGYFDTFDRIEYSHWDRSIEIEGETALVTQQFNMEVERGGKKNRYSGREALSLRREGQKWKIVKAF